ncbi:hypothetical protein GCM10009764_72920 [Nocardia ninae]|uniref:Uncharacterized protein n=1 Tax=Nocardia ninae NBRC 108245 TaxID=1210091 RepID=A0A511MGM8_9NOCA|nr:hypothetical protein NN4_43490 [Nocardia ninae NBRC 108245]
MGLRVFSPDSLPVLWVAGVRSRPESWVRAVKSYVAVREAVSEWRCAWWRFVWCSESAAIHSGSHRSA